MNAIAEAKQTLINFMQVGIYNALVDTFSDPLVKSEIADKNQEQLQRGERADNTVLPNYSPVSVAKFGKPAGPIRLYDKGDFYRGIDVQVDSEGVEVFGRDHKTPMLTERYGDEVLGIQPESWELLNAETVIPNLQDRVKAMIAQ